MEDLGIVDGIDVPRKGNVDRNGIASVAAVTVI